MKPYICYSILICLGSAIATEVQKPIAPLSFSKSTIHGSGRNHRHKLLALHKSLVEIESITGNEIGVGDFLVDYLTSRNYTAVRQVLPDNDATAPGKQRRFNVVAWPGSSPRPRPRLLVTSHIDVVPPYIPYKIDDDPDEVTEKTVIHGRGSVDAKASVAAQLVALDELLAVEAINAADVMLLYVVGEETSGDGMRSFSQAQKAFNPPLEFDAVIFGEPTENKLACGHKGGLWCAVKAKGKAGHSGYPWLGKSANEMLIRALVGILDSDLGSSELFGNTTVNVGLLGGGVAANVIPESAMAELLVRVATGPEVGGSEIAKKAMEEVLRVVDADALSLNCRQGYGAVRCDCEVDDFDTITVNYGTDVPNLRGKHTRYLYGPGDILVAHSDHEALTVSDLETAVKGYQKLIRHVLHDT